MRCKGKTKAGAQCKRNARPESEYCATHADQAPATAAPPADESESHTHEEPKQDEGFLGDDDRPRDGFDRSPEDWWDVVADVAMVGTVVVVALVFGRVLRVL